MKKCKSTYYVALLTTIYGYAVIRIRYVQGTVSKVTRRRCSNAMLCRKSTNAYGMLPPLYLYGSDLIYTKNFDLNTEIINTNQAGPHEPNLLDAECCAVC